jgi:hypothetical protein
MSGRLPLESDDEYFRRKVNAHKPVSDIVQIKLHFRDLTKVLKTT